MINIEDIAQTSGLQAGISGNRAAAANRVGTLDGLRSNAIIFVKDELGDSLPDALLQAPYPLVVVCTAAVAGKLGANSNLGCIVTATPRLSFMNIIAEHFNAPAPEVGVHPSAIVEPGATIDPGATVMAFCFIGSGSSVGCGTVIYPQVTIYPNCSIGSNVTIHASTVIGADGFGYERAPDGSMTKFPHLGGVTIEDDVEIGSNTSIDRGTLGDTIIRRGAKIDNQVHIAHNTDVGVDAVVIAQSMVGGSVRIGDRAWLAPAAVVMNQVRIGADSMVGMGAVVTKDVPDGTTVMGSPALPDGEFKAVRGALRRLVNEGNARQ